MAENELEADPVGPGTRRSGAERSKIRVYAGGHPGTGATGPVGRDVTDGIRAARSIRARLPAGGAGEKHGASVGTFGARTGGGGGDRRLGGCPSVPACLP